MTFVTGQLNYFVKSGTRLIARTITNITIPKNFVTFARIASLVLPSFFP